MSERKTVGVAVVAHEDAKSSCRSYYLQQLLAMGFQYIFINYDISSETLLTQGVFKCIDFGLAFSVEEDDLHQVIIII